MWKTLQYNEVAAVGNAIGPCNRWPAECFFPCMTQFRAWQPAELLRFTASAGPVQRILGSLYSRGYSLPCAGG